MHFKITARTILQLGSELISSDAIAFYELIKNSFDAGSKNVEVRIVSRISKEQIARILVRCKDLIENEHSKETLKDLKETALAALDQETYEIGHIKERLETCNTLDELVNILKKANFILIKDWGDGMSMEDLQDIYLTIGTRNRRIQRANPSNEKRPILGEKGLGRLSVMRLGDGLRVETTQAGESYENELNIDWGLFSHDSDALLESIILEPKIGKLKPDPQVKGTKIFIYDLHSEWSNSKLLEIAQSQLTRFIDPFSKKNRDFIKLWFNRQPVILSGIDKKLFDYAHAVVKADLHFDENNDPVFSGEIDYKTYDRQTTFSLSGTHLASVINLPGYVEGLRKLGAFSTEFYWYNRKLLTKSAGVLEADYIKELVATWGGGLMVYRDGFRVNPYGGPNDDWLMLDPTALASPGYKLNRRQLVGKVDISSASNPLLLDQTNREGLRENQEKESLVRLLQYLIWKELKTYLDDIKKAEDENLAALSIHDIEKRINIGQNQVKAAVAHLRQAYPEINVETEALDTIEQVLNESANLFKIAKASSDVLEDRLKTTIDLAGLGLMVDVIAHELNRSTEHALVTINSLNLNAPDKIPSVMNTLKVQLKTLQTRLKVIDPLGPSGRQQKTMTDLKKLIRETFANHISQFERHKILYEISDKSTSEMWNIKVVPGMIVQILENLISNSVYWIKQEQNINRTFSAKIKLVIDRDEEKISFTDNGPGIPRDKREEVFRPFVSTKPPGAGKGLGLYISKEIAKYHNASLSLLDNNDKYLNTFVLNIKNT